MKRAVWLFLALVVVAVAVVASLPRAIPWFVGKIRAPLVSAHAKEVARLKADVSIAQAKYAEAASAVRVRVETVRVTTSEIIALAPTVLANPGNKQLVTQFVHQSVSAARSCSALANDCETMRLDANTALAKKDTLIWRLEGNQRRWLDKVGVTVGYGVMVAPADSGKLVIRRGWQATVGVKVLPW